MPDFERLAVVVEDVEEGLRSVVPEVARAARAETNAIPKSQKVAKAKIASRFNKFSTVLLYFKA
jgi:hypothetical protein